MREGFGERSLPACGQQSRSRVFSAALGSLFLTAFSECLLEGPWAQNPCLETQRLYFQENSLQKTSSWPFSSPGHSFKVCVVFSPEIFHSDLGDSVLWFGHGGLQTLGSSGFILPIWPLLPFQKPMMGLLGKTE